MRSIHIVLCSLVLLGCEGSVETTTQSETDASSDTNTAEVYETSTPDVNMIDAGIYNPCLTQSQKPTKYPRLVENDCVSSNGTTAFEYYTDTLLNIGCLFRLADDNNIRCLPMAWQSPVSYIDYECSQPGALMLGMPDEPYFGILSSVEEDAGEENGADAGTWMTIYQLGKPLTNRNVFIREFDANNWACKGYEILPQMTVYSLSNKVDPTIFVLQ